MFPRLLHQTWKTKDLSSIPEFQACADSWRIHHPEYKYVLWDDEENHDFVKSEFGWYYKTWMSFDKNIKRLDTIRYMWMHKFGGIYADLDMECLNPLDRLMSEFGERDSMLFCDFDTTGQCLSANPALLISRPGSDLWLKVLDYAEHNKALYVTECTGPTALARVARTPCVASRTSFLDQNKLFIRKKKHAFYSSIPGNEDDPEVYKNVFCVTAKPDKYYEDCKRKYVADWHGTPSEFRWHNEYSHASEKRTLRSTLANLTRHLLRLPTKEKPAG